MKNDDQARSYQAKAINGLSKTHKHALYNKIDGKQEQHVA